MHLSWDLNLTSMHMKSENVKRYSQMQVKAIDNAAHVATVMMTLA